MLAHHFSYCYSWSDVGVWTGRCDQPLSSGLDYRCSLKRWDSNIRSRCFFTLLVGPWTRLVSWVMLGVFVIFRFFFVDLLTHSWFHSMLFAFPGYQFPCTVMNRCFYLTPSRKRTPAPQHNTTQNKTKQNRPVALAGCSQTLVFDVFFTSLGSLA
jgi:hypothetical protein